MKKKLNEVLLAKTVKKLGKTGTIIKVKRGYSRNYLVPFKIAKRVTPEAIEEFKIEEQKLLFTKKDHEQKMIKLKQLLENLEPLLLEKEVVYDTEQLFGKVTKNEIFSLLKQKVDLPQIFDKTQIQLSNIKEVGKHIIPIMLTKEIAATISLVIKPK